jgi:peptidoglycan/LPS O-acetylase OafA/YrhL
LRAVAVGAVLLYHAGIPFVKGGFIGVDVFFVISGFLITGLLLRELEGSGTISLVRFYSRRAKRLLPLTVVVLGAIVLCSWWLFDPIRMERVSLDVVAAGLYVLNWLLAFQAANYFSAGLQASPVQHFWTLAVEEQFYLVWPMLMLTVAFCYRHSRLSLRSVLVTVLALVALLSFVYGVYATQHQAAAAYFSTFSRAWELALGGVVALAPASALRMLGSRRWTAGAVSWAGLGAILISAYLIGDDTPYPGVAALLPTLGAAGIIIAGSAKDCPGPGSILTLKPVRHVGRISYSWYLWHWPPLVFAAEIWGNLSPIEGLAVALSSYLPALVTNLLIERPFLHSPMLNRLPLRALGLGAACTACSVTMGLFLLAVTPGVSRAPHNQMTGARAILAGKPLQESADKISPTPRDATDIRSEMFTEGCLLDISSVHNPQAPKCVFGDTSSDKTVVIFGDSHAMQWFPALNQLAKEHHWRLIGHSKGGCTPAKGTIFRYSLRREYRECDQWRANTLKLIAKEEHPDMVIVSSSSNYHSVIEHGERQGGKEGIEKLEAGYASTLETLKETGAEVVVIKDVPHPAKDVPECVSQSLDHLRRCATPAKKAFGSVKAPKFGTVAAHQVKGTTLIDPKSVFCSKGMCPAVIGNVLVYRSGSHITPEYMRTLTPWLDARLPSPGDS